MPTSCSAARASILVTEGVPQNVLIFEFMIIFFKKLEKLTSLVEKILLQVLNIFKKDNSFRNWRA